VPIDEDSAHSSGHMNSHNIRIWNSNNSNIVVAVKGGSFKVSIRCAVSKSKVFLRVFFF